jgi:hypothetical protein
MTDEEALVDLCYAVQLQNNMLAALIRSHPSRDVLATNFSQAQSRFPEAAKSAHSRPGSIQRATLSLFETALQSPLGPAKP